MIYLAVALDDIACVGYIKGKGSQENISSSMATITHLDNPRSVPGKSERPRSSGCSEQDGLSATGVESTTSSRDIESRAASISSMNSARPLLATIEQRWIPPSSRPPTNAKIDPVPAEDHDQNQHEQPKDPVLTSQVPEDVREMSYWTSRDAALPGTAPRPRRKSFSEEDGRQRPSGERSWTSSTYDTSSLTDEQIAKMRKKGINPSLYCEMKAAQRGKGKFGISPLVGNVFLG